MAENKTFFLHHFLFIITFIIQVRKITLVQACVRRWLAKIHVRKMKEQLAVSILTLQRHVRGWLTRRKMKVHQMNMQYNQQQQQQHQQNRQKEEQEIIISKLPLMFPFNIYYYFFSFSLFLSKHSCPEI